VRRRLRMPPAADGGNEIYRAPRDQSQPGSQPANETDTPAVP
jgi:hypothetical protein